MKILVINTGSSTIKYTLFDMGRRRERAAGTAERIGAADASLTHRIFGEGKASLEVSERKAVVDHRDGLERIASFLADRENGILKERSEVAAVGHRVVHGGESFKDSAVINDRVVAAIRENIRLAPLHNPSNLTGIEVAREVFPRARQVAVFDTSFHQTLPPEAFLYAVPLDLYEKHRVRRYGFHGTSHAYVAERAADFLDRPLEGLNLITLHLGNGASMAAVRGGRCVDTTMGMTPLAGLVMGTRSGDVDPALPFFLADDLGMSVREIDDLLNRESGLKGLGGTSDMREILARKGGGDTRADLAVKIYTYRIRKYIGAFLAVLGSLDALVFTAGIGENSPEIRELSCRGLEGLGIAVDPGRNDGGGTGIREIGPPGSSVKVLVVPTNEELRIAEETMRVVGREGRPR